MSEEQMRLLSNCEDLFADATYKVAKGRAMPPRIPLYISRRIFFVLGGIGFIAVSAAVDYIRMDTRPICCPFPIWWKRNTSCIRHHAEEGRR